MSVSETPGSQVTKQFLRDRLPKAQSTAPTNPQPGDVWYDTGLTLTPTPDIVASDTAPANPAPGDVWFDTKPLPIITVGATPPQNPAINDVWIDTNS